MKIMNKLTKITSKHFLTANNKPLEKNFCGWKLKRKQIETQSQREKISGILVYKDILLDIKLFRYKNPLLL